MAERRKIVPSMHHGELKTEYGPIWLAAITGIVSVAVVVVTPVVRAVSPKLERNHFRLHDPPSHVLLRV